MLSPVILTKHVLWGVVIRREKAIFSNEGCYIIVKQFCLGGWMIDKIVDHSGLGSPSGLGVFLWRVNWPTTSRNQCSLSLWEHLFMLAGQILTRHNLSIHNQGVNWMFVSNRLHLSMCTPVLQLERLTEESIITIAKYKNLR